ncbi:MAG: DUF664 domain-containing protein [Marmoricola sp.]
MAAFPDRVVERLLERHAPLAHPLAQQPPRGRDPGRLPRRPTPNRAGGTRHRAARSLDGILEPTETRQRFDLVHHVEELARHAGHTDLIREQIDGATAAQRTTS